MTIEKLHKNSWRIRKTYGGKTYSVVVDYKPTQKEALKLIADAVGDEPTSSSRMSFNVAGQRYIESKENVLSPSTIKSYHTHLEKQLSNQFKAMLIKDISPADIQAEINRFAKDHSAKTVRNLSGFISAVFGLYRPGFSYRISLPQKEAKDLYIPSDDDVKKVLAEATGTEYEVPFKLAVFALRRSEICALTKADVSGNILTINKAKVPNKYGVFVIKKMAKTDEGNRKIFIPDDLAKMIKGMDEVFPYPPDRLSKRLKSIEKKLGLPYFSIHKLRHYYCSMAHANGIPDAYIMEMGGWKSDYVMKRVYRHAQEEKSLEMQKKAGDFIEHLF